VEDLCLQAQEHGLTVLVAPGPAGHRGDMWPQAAWLGEYGRYRQKLLDKWPDRAFTTT